MHRPLPRSTLFPYTTLFRSGGLAQGGLLGGAGGAGLLAPQVGEGALVEAVRSEEHTSELQSLRHLVCRLLLEKKKKLQTGAVAECEHYRSVVMDRGHSNISN